ncbi:carboxy terminal-processing peptidase [Halomonas caseinilytica]|uniref:C-terminal processing peptidase-1. Serine peptidase. MEROPS family S41A n=1 Tax=Halomonas caseinilytica TaxID=438744 RepID=A0A1M6Y3N4_9GAMM|nr:carboxy terminal-processing peptidase [Halomonas caseinilytica]SHL12814.1 C-terminal processing peptidase-1. Serine peptidase. MEROPS family S41A [Halomonas caseinilytica]
MSLFATLGRTAALAMLLVAGPALADLAPSDAQRQTAEEIADSLLHGHYSDIDLDDDWSKRAFQHYLDVLDGQRAYLLRSDIDDFQDLSTRLDEAVLDGELARPFALYERYQTRVEDRLEWLLARLDEGLDFTFDGDQRMILDRSDMPWPTDEAQLDALWTKRLKNAALELAINRQDAEERKANAEENEDSASTEADSSSSRDDDTVDEKEKTIEETLRERYEGQLNRIRQINAEDVFDLLMTAVTGTIDPHTNYMSPRESEDFDIQMKLSLEGIGALLQADGEYVKVSSLVPGGPAEKAGVLEPADRIIGVGQEDEEIVNVVGMRLDEVVDMIRGPKGSVVRLEIVPGQAMDMTRSKVVEITRDTVKLEDQAAQSEVVEIQRDDGKHRVGVIKVPAFYVDFDAWQAGADDYRSTTRDVAKEIEKLRKENVEGIVLDLRNNGGGALQEANSMLGLFIDRGPTVQVRDARGRINLYGDTDSGSLYDGPLVVLVNRLSASASEIFAGAIQDYGRGLVVGSNTFGKGTVQTLNDLDLGQIKLTRAKFYRISGDSTQNRGVVPDIQFPSLVDPESIGESSLDNALGWDSVRKVQYRQYGDPRRYLDILRERHRQRADDHPNFHYLERRATLAERLREQHTSVSLNREQRRQETQARENEQLALENERREALGLEPLDNWIDSRGQDEEEPQPLERAPLTEAAEILLDFSRLESGIQFAEHE